jgi:hypothetical protein
VNGLCVLDGEIKRQAEVGYLCGWHRDRLDFLSSEIAILWCELALILDGSAPREWTEKTKHVKAAEAPAPLDLEAAVLRISIPAEAAWWTLQFANDRPLRNLPGSVVGQFDLMQKHHDWAASWHRIVDYANWLEQTRKLMRRTVRDWIGQILGTCDWPDTNGHPCGGKIMRENGTETVRCNKCGRIWESGRRVVC